MNVKVVKVLTGHSAAIYDVLVESKSCYTTSSDKYTVKWDLIEGKQDQLAIKLNESGFRISLNPSDNLLAIGTSKGGIHVIDLNMRQEKRYLAQHKTAVFSLTYNPVTNEFYSGDAEGYFCVWSGDSFDLKMTLPFVCGKIRQIRLDDDGKHIALCGQDGIVRILETGFYNVISEFKAHKSGVNCALFDGERLITGGKNAYISSWEWKTGKLLQEIPAHNYAVYDLLFLKDKSVLVSASFDKTVKLWKASDLAILKRIERKDKGHTHVVNRLAKVSDKEFISVGDDRQIIYWEIEG